MVRTSLILICFLCSNIHSRLSPEDEQCVRCICEASTACFSILECAKKGISVDYWRQAGALVVTGGVVKDQSDDAYAECIQDESCVLETIDSYTKKILRHINDVNCDGIVDCRDYFSAHKFGTGAKNPDSVFKPAQTKRFDRCEGHGVGNLTDGGWKPGICFTIRNNFS
jgi:hypothetical protein